MVKLHVVKAGTIDGETFIDSVALINGNKKDDALVEINEDVKRIADSLNVEINVSDPVNYRNGTIVDCDVKKGEESPAYSYSYKIHKLKLT